MTTERITRLMAGTFVLIGTGLCPAENIVRALGARDAAGPRE